MPPMDDRSRRAMPWRAPAGMLLTALVLLRPAVAASVDPVAPAAASVSAAPTTVTPVHVVDLELALRAQLERERARLEFPGATAAYVLPDGRSGSVAVGFGDAELRLPMRPDSRMPAGSIGKTFVAALALSLVADGKLSLDDHLSKWLGNEDWFDRLPNGADILIRHLLNHSAGIGNHVETRGFGELVRDRILVDPGEAVPPRVLVGFILDEPPLFPAGKGYAYTDTGYILLQLAIEKAGGISLGEEVVHRFLYPLQLNSTSPAAGQLHPGVVQGYVDTQSLPGLPPTALDRGVFRWNPLSEWAGGGFISNSLDLARWARALYDGPALPSGIRAQMVSAPNVNTSPQGYTYGLGVVIRQTDSGPVWGHSGEYPGYRSNVSWFPDSRVAVAVQVNSDRIEAAEIGAMGRALGDVVLKACSCSGSRAVVAK